MGEGADGRAADGVTLDRPAPGLCIAQPERGFRYGAEAFWLAGFALEGLGTATSGVGEAPKASGGPRRALDLGTGSGIVAALLARAGLDALGIDVRPEWAPLWERTLAESRVPGRLRLEWADVASGAWSSADLVTTNPPFFAASAGPAAADPWRAAARTEGTATLADFVRVGLAALGEGGRVCIVVPTERSGEVRDAAAASGAGVTRAVRVGRLRWLGEIVPGASGVADEVIDESHPRAARWYALARGT